MDTVIRCLALTLILTSFLVTESRDLRRAVAAYAVQALVMVAIIACFAPRHPALWAWAGTALVTKVGLITWMLRRAVGPAPEREVPPLVGAVPSALFIAGLALAVSQVTHRWAGFLAASPLAQTEPYRTNVAVALTIVFLGVYCIATRRDALKVVMGLCLMENGVHLSLVTLAVDLRETVLIGIVTDVVVAVYLLLAVIHGIERELGTRDTARLSRLRW